MLIHALILAAAAQGAPSPAASTAPASMDQSPAPAPIVTPSMAAEDPAITAQAKAQYNAWKVGRVDRSLYSAEFNGKVTDAIVGQVSSTLQGLGDPTSFTFLNRTVVQGNTIYTYQAATPKGNVQMLYLLDPAGKIGGILFRGAP